MREKMTNLTRLILTHVTTVNWDQLSALPLVLWRLLKTLSLHQMVQIDQLLPQCRPKQWLGLVPWPQGQLYPCAWAARCPLWQRS